MAKRLIDADALMKKAKWFYYQCDDEGTLEDSLKYIDPEDVDKAPTVDAVVLPCKVGDKIYKLWSCGKNGKAVAEFEITHIDIDYLPEIELAFRKPKGTGYYYFAKVGEIGKTVFLTREEAEAALAKMDGERKEK